MSKDYFRKSDVPSFSTENFVHEAGISTLFRFDVLSNGALMFCESTFKIIADYRINTGSSFNT